MMPRNLHGWRLLAAIVLALLLIAAGVLLFTGEGIGGLGRRDATWAEIERSKDLRVGLDPSFPPFETLGADGLPQGYDVDLALALAAEWGVVAKINPIGFDSLIDALRAARVDAVISAMPFDERLTKDVTYSQPYFDAGIQLAVRSGSPITGTAGLAGGRVAVEWGSTGDMVARRLHRGGDALPPVDFEIVQFDTPAAAIDALLEDATIDAVLVDQVTLRMAQGQGAEIAAAGPILESVPYVIVTPRKATTLAAKVNQALADFAANGTLDALEDRWFGSRKGVTP
jgi:ABC-type amino acid transport substrate-binding protein